MKLGVVGEGWREAGQWVYDSYLGDHFHDSEVTIVHNSLLPTPWKDRKEPERAKHTAMRRR